MLYKSALLTVASGSIGGITASHNSGGQYFRARTTPTNPNSAGQQAARTALSNATSAWANLTTLAQQAAWNTYAANVPLINRLGDPVFVSGLAHYVRSNVPRLRLGLSRVDDAPTIFTLAEMSPISIALTDVGDVIDVTFDNTDDWAAQTGSYLFLQVGQPQNPTINFYKGPFRATGQIVGSTGIPPGSPFAGASVIPFSTGQRVFVRARASDADGRLSPPQIVFADVP